MIVCNSKPYVFLEAGLAYSVNVSQKTEINKLKFDRNKKTLKVGASCGICMLNMKGMFISV